MDYSLSTFSLINVKVYFSQVVYKTISYILKAIILLASVESIEHAFLWVGSHIIFLHLCHLFLLWCHHVLLSLCYSLSMSVLLPRCQVLLATRSRICAAFEQTFSCRRSEAGCWSWAPGELSDLYLRRQQVFSVRGNSAWEQCRDHCNGWD